MSWTHVFSSFFYMIEADMNINRIGLNDKRWLSSETLSDEKLSLMNLLKEKYPHASTAFLELLVKRFDDFHAIEGYLEPNLEQMHDPFLLKGMSTAVNRIHRAIASNESIWLYGDYDVDGITSVSLLVRAFKAIGVAVNYYIPDRHEEGYGLNVSAIETLQQMGAKVVITVDCGITSVLEAERAKELGIDLIITDHHEPQPQLPEAFALINPKQSDCKYPYSMLAGVGLAYKLASALLEEHILPIREELLALAAFGTIADIAPLDGENRIIAKHGLKALMDSKILGFQALIKCSDLEHKKITAGHVGFMLAPKINAAGRIDDPKKGVVLLTTEDFEEAVTIAEILKETNDKRQALEKDIIEEALSKIESREDLAEQHITIVSGEGWNSGVIGIVASRLVERYGKPAIVFSIVDGVAKGSARSIEGFDIFENLLLFSDMYLKFGGHEQAAGLSITETQFHKWQTIMEAHCQSNLPSYLLVPAIHIEQTLQSKDVTYGFLDELAGLEPYGVANPRPIFKIEQVSIQKKVLLGKNKEFTKFEIADGVRTFEAISFDKSGYHQLYKVGDQIDLICHIDVNEFKGTQTIQFQLKDIRGYRKELCKLNTAFSYFAKAKSGKIIELSGLDVVGLSKLSEQLLSKLKATQSEVWLVDTEDALINFYHRLSDDRSAKLKVFCNGLPEGYVPSWGSTVLILCPHSRYQHPSFKSVEECFSIDEMPYGTSDLLTSIPEREDLIVLYKAIRNGSYLNDFPESAIEWLGVQILEDAQLIRVTGNGLLVEESPSAKIDLMEVPLYKALQVFKQSLKSR